MDNMQLVLCKKLCKDYGWRFNSSAIQIKNGTISVIVKGEVYEISCDLQVRRRRLSISPRPFSKSGVYVIKKLCNQGSYVNALQALHDKLGDDVLTNDVEYHIYYKTDLDSDYKVLKYDGLERAKSAFHQIIRNFNITDVLGFSRSHIERACVILYEKYGDYARVMDIRNTFDSADNVTKALK